MLDRLIANHPHVAAFFYDKGMLFINVYTKKNIFTTYSNLQYDCENLVEKIKCGNINKYPEHLGKIDGRTF